jgi:hypothetical protein
MQALYTQRRCPKIIRCRVVYWHLNATFQSGPDPASGPQSRTLARLPRPAQPRSVVECPPQASGELWPKADLANQHLIPIAQEHRRFRKLRPLPLAMHAPRWAHSAFVPIAALRFETNRVPMLLPPDRELPHREADVQLATPPDRELSQLAALRQASHLGRFRAAGYSRSPSPIHQSSNPPIRPPPRSRRSGRLW